MSKTENAFVSEALPRPGPANSHPSPGRQQDAAVERRWLFLGVAVLASVLVYLNILGNQFVYDDNLQIARNPQLRDPRNLWKAFSQPVWSFVAPQGKALSNYYRPLHVLTYTVVYQFDGLEPLGYHLASLLFHSLTTAMVYLLALRLAGRNGFAVGVALLFAVHPIHTESVTWIAGIPDLQCAFFYLLAFYGWLRWRGSQGSERARRLWLLTAGIAFLLALLAKEMAVTLPVLVLLYELGAARGPTGTLPRRRVLAGFVALGGVAAVYLGLRIWALGELVPISNGHELTRREYFLSVLSVLAHYFEKLLLPIRLNAYYVFSPSRAWFDPYVLLGAVLVVAAVAVLLFARRWPAPLRLPLFGAAWIFFTLTPVLAIRQVGYNVFAERYLYLPSVGACLVLGLLFWRLYTLRPLAFRMGTAGLVLLVLALFAVQTVRRNRDWKDELTLYQRTLQVSPNATVIHNALGRVFFQRGQFQQAAATHQTAAAAEQQNYRQEKQFLGDAYAGMGSAYLALGQVEQAQKCFNRALEYYPHHDAYLNLGVIAFQHQDFAAGYAYAVRAILAFPVYDLAYNNAGAALLALGRPKDAIPYLEQAVQLSPNYTQARFNLAIAYQQSQQIQKAIEQLRAVVEREPENKSALQFLDMLLKSASPAPAESP